eukprot:319134-Pyramimonas_sp.AAC.1
MKGFGNRKFVGNSSRSNFKKKKGGYGANARYGGGTRHAHYAGVSTTHNAQLYAVDWPGGGIFCRYTAVIGILRNIPHPDQS